ncbi:Hypothetical predicted protein, partial [Pelobates cultripes]
MDKNYFCSNQGGGDLRILPTLCEIFQENMQDVTGIGHPPYSQNMVDYAYEVIQQDDGQCPPQTTNLMNQFPHYHNSPTQPNAYYTMNSGQPWIQPLNHYHNSPTQPNAYYTMDSGQRWIPPLNQNQTPDYLNHVCQVCPHQAVSPTSTISSAESCTPASTISQGSTERVVSDVE